jgi:hypothetical protein
MPTSCDDDMRIRHEDRKLVSDTRYLALREKMVGEACRDIHGILLPSVAG